ncbi:MAG: hypothetical protein QM715_02310 [Nibricoccus sp.]
MNLKQFAYGVSTFIPGMSSFHAKGTGGTNSARYCYAVWMRHLVLAHQNRLTAGVPKIVGELGPGDSIGIGLAALLSGAEKYFGMDVVEHASLQHHAPILDEMIELFARRADIPDGSEFPNLKPELTNYAFPDAIISEARIRELMRPSRLELIRDALSDCSRPGSVVRYAAPWFNAKIIDPASVDMIYSQAVLEHVDDLTGTYAAMYSWLRRGGFISHQIDFKCHQLTTEWNGHWGLSDLTWKLMRGRRAYLLNREPFSTHEKLLTEVGFQLLATQKVEQTSALLRTALATRFSHITEADLTTSDAFVQAVKL